TNEFIRGCSGELRNICGVQSLTPPPNVPEAIIFSKADGVVEWTSCVESGPNVHAFEVDATHCGLPYHLDTLRIVHDLIENEPPHRNGKVHANGKAHTNGKVQANGKVHINGTSAASS
ncbi:MAG: hypothetical protein ACREQC_03310, partial [Candidatus Binataceae bacterium]